MTRHRAVARGVAVAAALAAVLPSAASAASGTTYCVLTAHGACPSGGVFEPNITAALAQVNGHAPGVRDTILIGPGSFQESGMTDDAGHPVDIVGAGEGVTTLKAPAATPATTLTVDDPSATLSNLSIDSPAGPSNTGLELAGAATNVSVAATADDQSGTGVKFVAVSGASSPSFTRGSVVLPFSSTVVNIGVSEGSKTVTGSVADSTISATIGTQGVIAVDRTRVTGVVGIESSNTGSMTLDDDLITSVAENGRQDIGILVEPPTLGGGTRSALIRHCTVIGAGSAGSVGSAGSLGVSADSEAIGQSSVAVAIDSSIIRGYAASLQAVASGGSSSLDTASATIAVDYSDFETENTVERNGGSTATATITPGPHVTVVDPQFAATTGPLAFQLSAGSPLIDAGNPTLGGEESSTDLLGRARVVAGRGSDAAISDIGAFEFDPVRPTVSATAATSGVAGTPVTFTASGGDPAPGDSVALAWTFDDGGSATGTTVRHTFDSAGPHQATVTATDLDGFTAQATVAVTIAPVPVGVISDLRVQPSRLLAAGSTHRRHRTGALVTYLDTEPGDTEFAVLRLLPGVRTGQRCVKQRVRQPHVSAKRCLLLVPVGSFSHLDQAGANEFRFTGRVGGRALRQGSYRLVATPHDAGLFGLPVSAGFRVTGH